MRKIKLCRTERFNNLVAVFIIFFGLFCNSARSADETERPTAPITPCEKIRQEINSNIPQDADQPWLLEHIYKPRYTFANSPDGNNCQSWMIERIYFDYGKALLDFAKSLQDKGLINYSNQASDVFYKYLEWWTELDETEKDNIIKSNISGLDLQSPAGKKKKYNWMRGRPGGVVKFLIEAKVLSNNFDDLLTNLETLGQKDIYVFNQESVQEWDKWLSSQDDFKIRRRDIVEIKKVNQACDLCNERWKTFGKFLENWLSWNVNASTDIKRRKSSLNRLIS